jgi:hypothetical protein
MALNLFAGQQRRKIWADFLRLVNNHRWEADDNGDVLIAKARVSGIVTSEQCGRIQTVNNTWTTEGLMWLLRCCVAGGTPTGAVYVAPFGGNVTPATTWTAGGTGAGFKTVATELSTEYSEVARVEYVESAPAASGNDGSTNNTSNKATITAASATTIYGIGILTHSTKQLETAYPNQALLAAAKFATAEVLSAAGASLGIGYTLNLSPD